MKERQEILGLADLRRVYRGIEQGRQDDSVNSVGRTLGDSSLETLVD